MSHDKSMIGLLDGILGQLQTISSQLAQLIVIMSKDKV